jgi:hypothetical protein
MHIFEPGEHGQGMMIRTGDRPVIPAGWLKLSLNPLHGNGRLSRAGIQMLAGGLFVDGLYKKEETYEEDAAALERYVDELVNAFPPLQGLDVNRLEDAAKIVAAMQEHKDSHEFLALWIGQFLAMAREARAAGNAVRASWATACAERLRALLKFRQELEEVVVMGSAVRRVIDVLGIWDAQKGNAAEEFWQLTFNEHSYVLSQVFAVPVVFIQDKAYVGGMKVDRSEGRLVDYLFSARSSREAILIEIKPPTTKLLSATEYRGGVFSPSRDLSGAVVQVQNYRAELVKNLRTLVEDPEKLSAFSPKCVVIVGNGETELAAPAARRSFELYRSGLRDVEVITYDELFGKVAILAELFNLTVTKKAAAAPAAS